MQFRTGSRVQPLKKCRWTRGRESPAEPPADLAPRGRRRPPADGDKRLQGAPAQHLATLGALCPHPGRQYLTAGRPTPRTLCAGNRCRSRGEASTLHCPGWCCRDGIWGERGGCLCHSLHWEGALVAADTPPARTAGSVEDR